MKKALLLCSLVLLSMSLSSQEVFFDFNRTDLVSIMKEDFYEVFPHLLNETTTPLLKKSFEKSDDYKKYLAALVKAKEELLSGSIQIDLVAFVQNYDLDKKGFPVILGRNGYYEDKMLDKPYNNLEIIPEKTIGKVYYTKMQYSIEKLTKSFSKIQIFVPCDEDTAVKIEKANQNGRILLRYSFMPQKVISQTTDIICETREGKIKKEPITYEILQVENINLFFFRWENGGEEERLFSCSL